MYLLDVATEILFPRELNDEFSFEDVTVIFRKMERKKLHSSELYKLFS